MQEKTEKRIKGLLRNLEHQILNESLTQRSLDFARGKRAGYIAALQELRGESDE